MRLLVIGPLSSELGHAAQLARAAGATVCHADRVDAAIAQLRSDAEHDLIFCDVVCGISTLVRALGAERIAIGVVACCASLDSKVASKAIHDGAIEFLSLPADPDFIAGILQGASASGHCTIARDPVMLALLARVSRVAKSDASIMITGESGTGKEVIARRIHRESRRHAGPFVALNCAAVPEQLLESELFGHEKGAFSGAVSRRVGKFESAQRGTLLLDEITEMDVRLQAKLLRAIQEREIDRVGGVAPVSIDVRILATSNRDLQSEIRCGRFREDLFFRLNVIGLNLPPLRDRRGDIPALVEHYTHYYADVNGLPRRSLTDAASRLVSSQAWPGNVRELENALHRAVLLAEGAEIGVEAFSFMDEASRQVVPSASGEFVARRMQDVERDTILQTLNYTSGNRTHAATILGISIRALRDKLRDYAESGAAVTPPARALVA